MLFTKAPGTPSMGWRCRAPSREGLRSPSRGVISESLCAPGDQPEKERGGEREREREREKESKTRRPKLWWSKGVLFNTVWVFILSYKVAFFRRDKIKTYKLSRKHEVIHMKERGLYIITFIVWFIKRKRVVNSYLSLYGKTNEGNACIPNPRE